mgnify:CR=1 FL=1
MRRQEVLRIPFGLQDVATCFTAASNLLGAATDDAKDPRAGKSLRLLASALADDVVVLLAFMLAELLLLLLLHITSARLLKQSRLCYQFQMIMFQI